VGLLAAGLLAAGCGEDAAGNGPGDAGADAQGPDAGDVDADAGPPETFAFETAALSLRVTVSPFGITLRNPAGSVVLATVREPLETPADPAANAYGPPAASVHTPGPPDLIHWGWDPFNGHDAPWTRFSETRRAWMEGAVLRLILTGPGTGAELHVSIAVTDNAMRVSMALEGEDAEELDRLGQTFALRVDEHFFGLGARPATVDHRGQSYDCLVEENGVGQGERVPAGPANPQPNGIGMTAVPVPFRLSTAGYGLHVEGDARSRFHLGSHRDDAWRLEVAGTRLQYTVWVGTPLRALADFTAATGRPSLPPEWAFGPRRRLDPDATVNGVPEWEALRSAGVPTTILEDTLPALPDGALTGASSALAARVRAQTQWGYQVIGYASPHVSLSDPRAEALVADAEARGLLVRNSEGDVYVLELFGETLREVALVDLTHPEGPAWLAAQLQPGLDLGYAGWRLEHGEYTPLDAWFADGRSGAEVRNLYPILAQEAVRAGLQAARSDDGLLTARSGWTGTASRATMMWLSPLNSSFDAADGLASAVRATINLGLSGVPLAGADIGGNHSFSDPPADRELYLRWAAFAAFSPAMHDENRGLGSHEVGDRWTLWRDAQTTQAYAALARRHTRLAPYRRALARQAVETGVPLVRHPILVHPDDPQTWTLEDQYFLGPALLVAPILERGTFSREVYFPAGRYVGWDSGRVVQGPTVEVVEAAFEDIPVFLVNGGIVPMLDARIETLAPEDHPDVVGPADVAEWLDVRAVRSPGESGFELADTTRLSVAVTGTVRPPFMVGEVELPVVFTVEQAQTCEGCYLLRDDTDPPRLWVTTPLGENVEVRGQGIRLTAQHPSTRPRKVRWDVILLPPAAPAAPATGP
jgi:sulfoquinovosidase